MYKISMDGHFCAAHFLENYKGKCQNVHGHIWNVVVTVGMDIDPDTAMLIDFHDFKDTVKAVLEPLDHAFIINSSGNQVSKDFYALLKKHHMRVYELGGRTTAENLAKHLYYKLKDMLPPCESLEVEVFENPTHGVKYTV